nr:unnamed protein product [Callosobruchus chinensis]
MLTKHEIASSNPTTDQVFFQIYKKRSTIL